VSLQAYAAGERLVNFAVAIAVAATCCLTVAGVGLSLVFSSCDYSSQSGKVRVLLLLDSVGESMNA
jgi:hypothetical protein